MATTTKEESSFSGRESHNSKPTNSEQAKMTIERRNYIATPSDVEKLAAHIIDSQQSITSARGVYLKALIATTQAELGAEPRQRSAKGSKLSPTDIEAHMKAFQAVFARFHASVVKVAENTVPAPDAALVRQRTGFSRSAGSTVRGYIRAGLDVRLLAAHKVTKAALATPTTRRKVSAEILQRRAAYLAERLEEVARKLHAANKELAHDALGPLLARLAQASGATEHSTRDPKKAIEERIPLSTKIGVFVPMSRRSEPRLNS